MTCASFDITIVFKVNSAYYVLVHITWCLAFTSLSIRLCLAVKITVQGSKSHFLVCVTLTAHIVSKFVFLINNLYNCQHGASSCFETFGTGTKDSQEESFCSNYRGPLPYSLQALNLSMACSCAK